MDKTKAVKSMNKSTKQAKNTSASDVEGRALLFRYVQRFLRSLPASEGLMRLAISSLNLESRTEIIALAKMAASKRPQTADSPNGEVDVMSSMYELGHFLDGRVRGDAFLSWWAAFSRTVVKCFRREALAFGEMGMDPNRVQDKTTEMWRRIGLSRVERDLLAFLYCGNRYLWLKDFVSDSSRWNLARTISVAISHRSVDVAEALSEQGRLVRLGLIEFRKEDRLCETLEIASSIAEFLSGVDWETTVSEYYSPDSGGVYALESFSVSEQTTSIVKSLLQSNAATQLLLHGIPGTGKTEYARSLARTLGIKALIVKHGREGKLAERRLSLQLAATLADPERELLIVDEADIVLNTGYRLFGQQSEVDKGWLNDFLDRCRMKVIWITNEILTCRRILAPTLQLQRSFFDTFTSKALGGMESGSPQAQAD